MQACKVLREEGYEIVLVNSNPATIMTDPEFADATYVEPLLPGPVAQVIERERPDALLPTLGGQTALNLAKALSEDGTLERYGVELIGATYDAITPRRGPRPLPADDGRRRAADARQRHRDHAWPRPRPRSTTSGCPASSAPPSRSAAAAAASRAPRGLRRGRRAAAWRPRRSARCCWTSPSSAGASSSSRSCATAATTSSIVCSIENVDPMGVHTGDSVTVAPQQTLTDHLYQQLRDQAIAVIRAVGVETGGSNVQFAVNPATEEILVIEMNPRVSRSSALASKATGFPIAKIAARLAVGYALEEIPNDITEVTPAAFEPTIDYVVVKWPRFAFEKFPGADAELTTHMKSVGEAMAIGRTFGQAFAKAMRSRELDAPPRLDGVDLDELLTSLERPRPTATTCCSRLLRRGAGLDDVRARTGDRPVVPARAAGARARPRGALRGRADLQGGRHLRRGVRGAHAVLLLGLGAPARATRSRRGDRPSVVILGAGPEPHRPGHRVRLLLRARGHDRPRVGPRRGDGQLQPGDGVDRLRHLRPAVLRAADARGRPRRRRGRAARGRHRPVRRPDAAQARRRARGRPACRSSARRRRDRPGRGPRPLRRAARRLGYEAPPYATAHGVEEALGAPRRRRLPAARAPELRARRPGDGDRLLDATGCATTSSATRPRRPARAIFLDRFLENAIEVDVDALCDGEDVWIGGIMQHVEEAGIHSGDSACVLPPHSLGHEMLEQIRAQTRGHRARPRRRRAGQRPVRRPRRPPLRHRGQPARVADGPVRLQGGRRAAGQDRLPAHARRAPGRPRPPRRTDGRRHVAVKEAVLPFDRFAGADALLGPEMRSTGEVMGVARDFPTAFAKAQAAAGAALPAAGTAFITVTDSDKPGAVAVAQVLHDLGFRIVATRGTAEAIERMGIPALELKKIGEGSPNVVDWIESGEVDLVVNTPTGSGARTDGWEIRRAAVTRGVPCLTTLSAGWPRPARSPRARAGCPPVLSLQEVHRADAARAGPAARAARRRRRARADVGGAAAEAVARRPGRPRELAGCPRPRPVAAGPGAHAPPRPPGPPRRCRPCRAAGAAAPRAWPARPRAARPAPGTSTARAGRAGRRLRQGRGRRRRASARWASAPSRSGPSPRGRSPATRGRASRACRRPRARQPPGLQQPAARRPPPRASRAGAPGPRVDVVVGVNLGRTKVVPDAEARRRLRRRRPPRGADADYVVVNVSSPNTPGLRDLQAVAALRPLLVAGARRRSTRRAAPPRPPAREDRAGPGDDDVDAVADLALELGLDGIVATNTTVGRPALASDAGARSRPRDAGGLSGPPLAPRALAVLRRLRARTGDRLVLVAAGGVETPEDAWAAAARGRDVRAGLHGLRARRPALAGGHARGARGAGPPRRLRDRRRGDRADG